MKTFFQVICFALLSLVVVSGNCAESYRANGVIDIVKKQGIKSTGISSNVISGVPIVPLSLYEGVDTFSLVFDVEPPPSDKYTLTISLLTNPKSVNGISTNVLLGTFQSSLVGGDKGPLEFEMKYEDISIIGSIALSLKR